MRYLPVCRQLYCLKQTLCPFCLLKKIKIKIKKNSKNVLGVDELFNFELKST